MESTVKEMFSTYIKEGYIDLMRIPAPSRCVICMFIKPQKQKQFANCILACKFACFRVLIVIAVDVLEGGD